jgi:adenylyl- and sulfurtransferase ThiI
MTEAPDLDELRTRATTALKQAELRQREFNLAEDKAKTALDTLKAEFGVESDEEAEALDKSLEVDLAAECQHIANLLKESGA